MDKLQVGNDISSLIGPTIKGSDGRVFSGSYRTIAPAVEQARKEGLRLCDIAKKLGVSRTTVRKAIDYFKFSQTPNQAIPVAQPKDGDWSGISERTEFVVRVCPLEFSFSFEANGPEATITVGNKPQVIHKKDLDSFLSVSKILGATKVFKLCEVED